MSFEIKVHIALKDLYNFSFFTLKRKINSENAETIFFMENWFKMHLSLRPTLEIVFFEIL